MFFLDAGFQEHRFPVSQGWVSREVLLPWVLLLGSVLLATSAPATLGVFSGCSGRSNRSPLSHTYKIDVPKSAVVQVEADPQPLRGDGTQPWPQRRPRNRISSSAQHPPADATEGPWSWQAAWDLLARVKKLEEEMAEVKERCSAQRCCSRSSW